MKKIVPLLAVTAIFFAATPVSWAETSHEHGKEQVGGPKGGRLLDNTDPHAEFFIESDKTATITFYDEAMKPIAPVGQSAVMFVDTNGTKTKLEFEENNGMLSAKGKLPEGESHNVVLQLKQAPDAQPANFRFSLDDKVCGECKRPEYACICAH